METPRISKEELKFRIDNPDTLIIDVRRDQKKAATKIKNAVLEDPDKVDEWAEKYSGSPFTVLYCS